MSTLSKEYRRQLENAVLKAREEAERGAAAALESYGVGETRKPTHLDKAGEDLRKKLRAHGRQVGDVRRPDESQEVKRLVHECAYVHWHRILFARFLAENGCLIEPESGLDVDLEFCAERAQETKSDKWEVAAGFAQRMLTGVFRADDPVLQVRLPTEFRNRLTALLASLPVEVFTASDSLGWVYQFWQAKKKEAVNASGVKIGADELPSVTQLFTEDYMVDFLLDNTLGAWWAGKKLTAENAKNAEFESEEEVRQFCALPGCLWMYLRFIRTDAAKVSPSPPSEGAEGRGEVGQSLLTSAATRGRWTPAAGTFDGWPKTAKEIKCLDPCMGSGHFVVGMFERLVALRMEEEKLDEAAAVAAVIRDNLFGLEIDPRCTQIAAFNLARAAWRRVGHCKLPAMNLACSGLAPNTREADWLAIAGDNEKLKNGMERLYRLFQKAAVLGSLINPRAGEGDLLVAAFHELQPLLEKALSQESKDDAAHEMAVTARGLAKAAELLAGQFTLVATNVPYLGAKKQDDVLKDYCERIHPEAKADLATCFVERCLDFCALGGSTYLVTPQNWLFLRSYTALRESLLAKSTWNILGRLGPKGFQTPMWDFNIILLGLTSKRPDSAHSLHGVDVSAESSPEEKAAALITSKVQSAKQSSQMANPDARIGFAEETDLPRLTKYADCLAGIMNGDSPKFIKNFWEFGAKSPLWAFLQSTVPDGVEVGGLESVIFFDEAEGHLREEAAVRREKLHNADERGNAVWGRHGVAVSQMSSLPISRYFGNKYDSNVATIVPKDAAHLAAVWAFCTSPKFFESVRALDQKLNVTNATFGKVPFDLAHWQKVAAEKYPHGLPKPFSSDPTQWLFTGDPKGSDHALQVAVARLVGYRWPRQSGSSFQDCPALGPDSLEKHADDDGVVCFSQVRDEAPAATRLRALLADAYGAEWSHAMERKLIAASGSKAESLEEWLLNDFFAQHCNIFHNRPFVWHIWDGRRDGFNILLNYHKLAGPKGEGHRTLETLTYAYLGDWIGRQKDAVAHGEAGADDRLAAARELQDELKKIAAGEPPYDLFIRWKPLDQQPIGWEADLNDGVRLNIRPFMLAKLSRGKKGCGLFRTKLGSSVKWEKDRGNEPSRAEGDFPWFWKWDGQTVDFAGNGEFDGNRWNDCHYTTAFKRAMRERRK